jgi:hypothetical protein
MAAFSVKYSASMEGGEELTAVADQRDLAAVEAADMPGPVSRLRYVAWSALRRAGSKLPWEEFNARCIAVVEVGEVGTDDGEDEQGLDPGRKVRGGGST